MGLLKYFLLCLVLSTVPVWAGPVGTIEQSESGILLKFQSHPVSDVLERIHKATGIQITYPEDLRSINISISVKAADWPSAMEELLDGYNVMSMWGSDLKSSRIKILGGGPTIVTASHTKHTHPKLKVNGRSMKPALKHGDEIQVDRDYFKNHSPKRNDMVALKFNARERLMVKRILAVPGDHVEFRSNQMLINGKSFAIASSVSSSKILPLQLKRYGNRIPQNNYIVMGDNRSNSFDSGDFGLISMPQLEGKVIKQ